MAPFTETAKMNLREGVKKMESSLTPAARVRRDFQLGRPKKSPERDEPLHPAVVWQRSITALAEFRGRMVAANLDPSDATAFIVYVGPPDLYEPQHLAIDGVPAMPVGDKTPEDYQKAAFGALSGPDTLALGLVFVQMDRQAGQRAYFPYFFMALSLPAQQVLKRGADYLRAAIGMLDKAS